MADDHRPAENSLEQHLSAIESFLRSLLGHGPFDLSFSIRQGVAQPADPESPEYVVDFTGPDVDLLLEKNAALLHALEYVVLRSVRLDEDHRIVFDCQDWRQTRIQELHLMAQVAAERVMDSGDPFALSPMNPRERRIIHLSLRDEARVRTESEGFGPERKVVIYPAKKIG